MASIKQRPNGAYLISVSMGRDMNGKQIIKTATFHPTKTTPKGIEKEVNAFAVEFEKNVRDGELFDGDKITFRSFVKTWDEDWAQKNLAQRTREGYMSHLNTRVSDSIGNMKLSKIKAPHIQGIYNQMEKDGLSVATIKICHVAINSVLKYAFRMGVIKENPCDRCSLPKAKRTTHEDLHYFTVAQAKTFLKAVEEGYIVRVEEHKGHQRTTKDEITISEYDMRFEHSPQYLVYFTLAIYGGFRRGEMVALTWNDIDFDNKTVSINKAVTDTKEMGQFIKSTKTASGVRTIRLPQHCFDLLANWKLKEMELMFTLGPDWKGQTGKDFDSNNIFIQLDSGLRMDIHSPVQKFKKVIEMYNQSCENEEDRLPNIRLHDLRHTSATLLLSENVDIETVSHRLGHSKPSITMDVYGHWMEETDQKASDTLEAMFRM